ncbi:serine/threonine-protein kinase [Xylaria arbuscula]|nr:serine/threonine-protein kinase [Xylaria arbuscula]
MAPTKGTKKEIMPTKNQVLASKNATPIRKPAHRDPARPSPTVAAPSSHVPQSTDSRAAAAQCPYQRPTLSLRSFEIGKMLGKGSFGRVFLARHRDSGFICALKVLKKSKIRKGAETHVSEEIEIHCNVRHSGLIGFYGWFHDEENIVLILEYASGGDLFNIFEREVLFEEPQAAKYIAQVATALLYLHRKNIMHRDLKIENILVGPYGELKLADFGFSTHCPENSRTTVCGTLDYMAPEMIHSPGEAYDNTVDLWSLGVMAYEMIMGTPPFYDDSAAAVRERIVQRDMRPFEDWISAEAKSFIYSLLVANPPCRLPLEKVLTHPWIVKNSKLW